MPVNLGFFRNVHYQDSLTFDEGPRVIVQCASGSNTGSIDTSAIDGYRQGVELTQMKHFDAGIVKIHAGEPGHALRQTTFGEPATLLASPTYQDLDLFNPVQFLQVQAAGHSPTFPIITGDGDQLEAYNTNGVIEPLTIRSKAAFYSIEVPFESHDVRGGVMAGNVDSTGGSCLIETVREFAPDPQPIPFLDMVDMFAGRIPMNGYFIFDHTTLAPFFDEVSNRNAGPTLSDSTMIAAMSSMTGSTDGYVSFKQRSSAAGWEYDNATSVGTDSIAFGGMTF